MLRKLIVVAIVGNFVFMLLSVLGPMVTDFRDTAVAANTTVTYVASANVPQLLNLSATLYKMKSDGSNIDWAAGAQSDLAFGTLFEPPTAPGQLWGQTSYAAVFIPQTSGRKYEVAWSGSPLQNTNDPTFKIGAAGDNQTKLAEDAFLVVPDYQEQDLFVFGNQTATQGPCPGTVEDIAKVVSGGKVYISDNAGLSRILRAHLGVTGIPAGLQWVNYEKGHNGNQTVGSQNTPYTGGSIWDIVTPNHAGGSYSGGSVTFTLNLL